MATTSTITATEILDDVIGPVEQSFAPEFARMVLRWHLSDTAQERIRELLQQNNAGTLDTTGKSALENYLLVGQFLDLLHAKARVSLQNGATSP
jgi:hypothetical protein